MIRIASALKRIRVRPAPQNAEIRQAISEGFFVFISGMARGSDIWAAEVVLHLKNEGQLVRLICASPYEGFESGRSTEWQERYQDILGAADLVKFISDEYNHKCFQKRNEWMVRHSAKVLAVYNGMGRGTKNTVEFARREGIEVLIISG